MAILPNLTQEAAGYFKKIGLKITYKKGQLFVRPEDLPQGIYYLELGQAFVSAIRGNGSEQIIGIFEPGAIFGKVGSVIRQHPSLTSITALTDCTVFRLNCDQFQTLLKTQPAVLKAYMNQVAINNAFLISQSLVLGERDVYLKVIEEILLLATYFGDQHGQSCQWRIVLTQEQLANMLSISREYLNKTLKKLRDKNLLQVLPKGIIQLPDLTALAKELEKVRN